MPYAIPPFSQYQGQLTPVRCLWRTPPREGEYAIVAEIDWSTATQPAVQFNLSGNSPVALSQIVALYIDNGRNSAPVSVSFPDTGVMISVPAFAALMTPVATNALMLYASSIHAVVGDMTILQIFNSLPPPIAVPALASHP